MLIGGRRFMRRLRWSSRLLLRLHSRRLGKIRVVIDASMLQIFISGKPPSLDSGLMKAIPSNRHPPRSSLSSPVEVVHCSAYWTVNQTKSSAYIRAGRCGSVR